MQDSGLWSLGLRFTRKLIVIVPPPQKKRKGATAEGPGTHYPSNSTSQTSSALLEELGQYRCCIGICMSGNKFTSYLLSKQASELGRNPSSYSPPLSR